MRDGRRRGRGLVAAADFPPFCLDHQIVVVIANHVQQQRSAAAACCVVVDDVPILIQLPNSGFALGVMPVINLRGPR